MLRTSQVFAAYRQAAMADVMATVTNDLIPNFNAEGEDIRREWEEEARTNAALADRRKHARVLDLVHRRNEFIKSLNVELKEDLVRKAAELGGTIKEIEEEHRKTGKLQRVVKVVFTDNSMSRMPAGVWIDLRQFQRI